MKYIMILVSILGLDLGSKHIIDNKMSIDDEVEVVKNRFYIRHIKNNGLAYNKFAGEKSYIVIVTGIIIAWYTLQLLFEVLFNRKKYSFSLAMILGGAYGNFFERMQKGYVTDFMLIKKGKNPPIFNIADVSILIGFISYAVKKFKS